MAGLFSSLISDALEKGLPLLGQKPSANAPNGGSSIYTPNTGTPSVASKSLSLAPASADLGLGDQIKQTLADQEEERKKKMMGAGHKLGGSLGDALGLSSGY